MEGSSPKLVTVAELCALRQTWREQGQSVVQCHGCFDVVHPGHMRYLKFAREQGSLLVVSVTADEHVGKGYDRPSVHEALRAECLAELECVDFVCINRQPTAVSLLAAIAPDIYVKGREYETKPDPRFMQERRVVEGYGGRVIFSSGDIVYSSTAILGQIEHDLGLRDERVDAFVARNGITSEAVQSILGRLRGLRVLVIGDAIVDHYVHCESLGAAAEAPMLNLTPVVREQYTGGPALVAKQLASFGAHARLMTCAGEAPEFAAFVANLEAAGVGVTNVGEADRPVYSKTRYLVDGRKLLKVDEGRPVPISTATVSRLCRALDNALPQFDALMVVDFGYGLFGSSLCQAITALTKRHGRPYTADVSTASASHLKSFVGARVMAPTEQELRSSLADPHAGLSVLASRFYGETGVDQLAITLGDRGVVCFSPPRGDRPLRSDYLPALSRDARDSVGAGDVFLTTLGAAALCDAPLSHGIYLASAASALHVARVGNDPVPLDRLERFVAARLPRNLELAAAG